MSILERFRFLNSSPRAGLLALAIGLGGTLIWVQILGGTSTIRSELLSKVVYGPIRRRPFFPGFRLQM